MKTFDSAALVEKIDVKAFALSNDVRDQEAAKKVAEPVTITAPNFKADAFNAQLDNAYTSVVERNLPKPEVEDPEFRETLKAAFQSGNTIGSAISSQALAERLFPTKESPELTDDQIIDAVGKAGMMPLLPQFLGVTNQAQLEARISDIDREQKNLAIMEASGLTGVAASLVAGIVDIPTLIPVGKALQLGRRGASLGENVGKTALAGTVDASVSEAGLQATQELRTGEDAAINIASGAILGAAIGGGIHAIVGRDIADDAAARLDQYRKDALDNFPVARKAVDDLEAEIAAVNSGKPRSVGAAFNEVVAEARELEKLADAKVSAMYLDKIPSITAAPTEYLAKVIGGKTLLGRPRDAIRSSNLDSARAFGRLFYSSPEISEADAASKLLFKGMTVEDHVGEDFASMVTFKSEVENIYAANKTRFKSANDLAEQSYYAALNEGIDPIYKDPALEAVARAFNKYSDYQEAKHVANNRLAEDTQVMGSKSRVQRVYNQTALRNNSEEARELLYQWARRRVTQEFEEANTETGFEAKLTANAEAKDTFASRVLKREQDYEKAMADYKLTRRNLEFQDKQHYEIAMSEWQNRVAEWRSDPANDAIKNHPFGKSKPRKKDFVSELPDKPIKGEAETLTDGNAKPAIPKTKSGMKMTRQDIEENARKLADNVYNTLAGVNSNITRGVTGRVSVNHDFLKARVVDIPDDVLADKFFLRTNLLEHAERMHNTAGKQAAFGSVFKTKRVITNPKTGEKEVQLVGDYDGMSVLREIEEEADAVIKETDGLAQTALIDDRDRMLAGVKNEIDIALGSFDGGNGLIGPKAAHYMASAAYSIRLGGVTVSSLTDLPKIAISQGLGATFRDGVMPMIRNYREAVGRGGTMRAQGLRFGTVAEMVHHTRMVETFELHNPHAVGDKWVAFTDKATKMATSLSMISRWTDFAKQIAHNITSSRLLGYSEIGFDRLSKSNRAWLTNLGLDGDDLAKIKAEYGNQKTKHVAGILYADVDKWSDPELAARFAAAFRREGRNTVVSGGFGDRPQFAQTNEGQLIYQFQSFMLRDQIRFFARQAQLANIADDASEKTRQRLAFGASLSSIVLASVFVDSLKRAARDNDVDFEAFAKRWEDNPGGSMYDAIDRAGFMGSLFGASNTAGKFTNGQFSIRGGAQWLAGDKERGEARKVRDIGLGGAVFGPAAGIAEDLVKTGQAAGKVLGGGDLNRADLRRFQNTLPYHAVPGIQQGLNLVRELSETALGIPPEAPR